MPSATPTTSKPKRTKSVRRASVPAKKKGTWGGARPNSGRKPGPNPKVRHRARAPHDARHPLHVTLRRVDRLPSLRSAQLARLVRAGILDTSEAELEGFRVVLFTIAPKQIDFVVEADDAAALTRGLRSLTVRLAVRIKGALAREGHVWADRYRAQPLASAEAVHEVVKRVLGTTREHAQPPRTTLLKKVEPKA